MCAGTRHLLRSLTFFYALEQQSTTQSLNFTDENLFKAYLPIRDWGKNGDLNNLNVSYHIPNEDELKIAVDFVQTYVQISINYLNDKSNLIHKDDRFRELQFMYNLLVGSARLLKRPNRPIVNDQ
jgi:proteasome activator subunit 4